MTTKTTQRTHALTDGEDLPAGTTVRIAFDGRGLAQVIGHEDDGLHIIEFLDDPQRTSEHVHTGERVGCVRADMDVVGTPQDTSVTEDGETAAADEPYASSTHTVAPGVTFTVTGRPGHWTVWTSDDAGELHFAARSEREKAHSAAVEAHDAIVDAQIRAAGLQEMARAHRAAAAELAARHETTQRLWDALRANTVPAGVTAGNGKSGRRRGRRRGRGRGRGRSSSATAATSTPTKANAKDKRRAGARKATSAPQQPGRAGKVDARAAAQDKPARSGRRSRRRARGTTASAAAAVEASTTTTVTTATAATSTAVADTAVTTAAPVAVAVAPTAPAPTRTTRPQVVTQAPALPAPRAVDGADDDVAETRWAAYAQVDAHNGQAARLAGDVGTLGDALSSVLRGVLDTRETGRVRKLMRAGGLITGPTVYQEPAPRALRVAAAPVNPAEAQTLRTLTGEELAAALKSLVDAKTARTKARPLASR